LASAAYYALVYMVMNLTIFWVITRISHAGDNVVLTDLQGLHSRSPLLAFVLAVSAFALVGLPPTAGFIGKLFVLNSAWDAGQYWLVIIAVLNTALAIFYYLNLVRHAYTLDQGTPAKISLSPFGASVAIVLAVGVLYLGIVPQNIYAFLVQASTGIMS
jgi:NADH-quinone oxidoreductase subunit N